MASFAHTEYCMPRWHWTTTATLKTLLKERAKSARGEDSVASGAHYVHIAPTPVAASLTAGRDGRCTPGTMRWPLKKRQSQPRQGLRHLTICNRARASTSAARGSLVGQAFLATQSGACDNVSARRRSTRTSCCSQGSGTESVRRRLTDENPTPSCGLLVESQKAMSPQSRAEAFRSSLGVSASLSCTARRERPPPRARSRRRPAIVPHSCLPRSPSPSL
mmetsp:Transcript_103066/g.142623  ORF Transcript_103066/g.142623 Transcript_103066/m.142623 type:complete len:220 (-) Transcript_103066:188-847(-)